ncbi:phosphocholine cytidylyltransferase family protein [Flavobacteriales bacterium]|nr:phosphocholine cytidylyltransferase family protein [Flavobacteriales bacterium]
MSRAIILAAGRGSRMKEHTKEKPKCLNILANDTLLNWQLKSLNEGGVDKVIVVNGYKAELIKGDFEIVKNERWSETNMVASLFCVTSNKEDSIISYSDIVYKSKHIKALKKAEGDIIITADLNWKELWSLRFEDPLDDAETFKSSGNVLKHIGGKTNDITEIEAQYMGLLKLTKIGWNTMKKVYKSFSKNKQDKLDMTAMINELLKKKIEVNIVFVEGGWCESDSYSDIEVYENELKVNKSWIHNWK